MDIASQIDRERVYAMGTVVYMIDATKYGNVSRFINHRYLDHLIFILGAPKTFLKQFSFVCDAFMPVAPESQYPFDLGGEQRLPTCSHRLVC